LRTAIEPGSGVSNIVAEMSDDMLDDLLGDIDIDAAIAASGKVPSQVIAVPSKLVTDFPPPLPTEVGPSTAATFETTKKPISVKSGTAACQVDDDMIENLMQGLDGDDFADV
jgi:hypothetical protein